MDREVPLVGPKVIRLTKTNCVMKRRRASAVSVKSDNPRWGTLVMISGTPQEKTHEGFQPELNYGLTLRYFCLAFSTKVAFIRRFRTSILLIFLGRQTPPQLFVCTILWRDQPMRVLDVPKRIDRY